MPELKKTALRIFHETLAAIDIVATMQRKLRREGSLLRWDEVCVDLATFEKVFVVAIGKAAHAMVDGLALGTPPHFLPNTVHRSGSTPHGHAARLWARVVCASIGTGGALQARLECAL